MTDTCGEAATSMRDTVLRIRSGVRTRRLGHDASLVVAQHRTHGHKRTRRARCVVAAAQVGVRDAEPCCLVRRGHEDKTCRAGVAGRNRQRRKFSGGRVCFGVAVVLIVGVAGAAVEAVVDGAEVAGAMVTTGLALCWLLEQAASTRTTTTVMALRKMWR